MISVQGKLFGTASAEQLQRRSETLATGWQAPSVLGAMSGGLKKKLGLIVESEKAAASRVYRITDTGAA